MKIIFDNEMQKLMFITMMSASVYCPNDLNLNLNEPPACANNKQCKSCWEKSIEMYVEAKDGDNNG